MTYESLVKRINKSLADQIPMFLENTCWCGINKKPKLYIPKRTYVGIFLSCDECHTDLKLLKRELTPQEYFTVRIICQ